MTDHVWEVREGSYNSLWDAVQIIKNITGDSEKWRKQYNILTNLQLSSAVIVTTVISVSLVRTNNFGSLGTFW